MDLLRKTRLFKLLGVVVYLGLAVCVFNWGLEYKLSLYDQSLVTSHRIPQAKLLSENEQTGNGRVGNDQIGKAQTGKKGGRREVLRKTSDRISITVPAAIFLVLGLAFNELNPQASFQLKQLASRVAQLRHSQFEVFFVRPPPALA